MKEEQRSVTRKEIMMKNLTIAMIEPLPCFMYAKRNKMCGVWGGVFLPLHQRS